MLARLLLCLVVMLTGLAARATAEDDNVKRNYDRVLFPGEEPISRQGVYFGFLLTPKLRHETTRTTAILGERQTTEISSHSAPKLGFEWTQFVANSWNHGVAVDVAFLKFDSISGSTPSTTVEGSYDGGMNILTVAYAGRRRWEAVYLPVYLGLAASTVDTTGALTKTFAARVHAGLGLGVMAGLKTNLELSANTYGFTSDLVNSAGVEYRPSVGSISYVQLAIKTYFF